MFSSGKTFRAGFQNSGTPRPEVIRPTHHYRPKVSKQWGLWKCSIEYARVCIPLCHPHVQQMTNQSHTSRSCPYTGEKEKKSTESAGIDVIFFSRLQNSRIFSAGIWDRNDIRSSSLPHRPCRNINDHRCYQAQKCIGCCPSSTTARWVKVKACLISKWNKGRSLWALPSRQMSMEGCTCTCSRSQKRRSAYAQVQAGGDGTSYFY